MVLRAEMSCIGVIIALVALYEVHCESPATVPETLLNLPQDAYLNFTQLSAKYGHSSTTHEVKTDDDYILRLFNLPGDKTRPVLLCHGVFDTADGYIINGLRSLAIALAAAGYDVWIINFRGNRYSRLHATLNPDKDLEYWDYTLNEMGNFDLAACIDYVLHATGQESLSLIGFSQGTTASFILAASQPSYNQKIKIFIALAPIVFLNHVRQELAFIIKISQFLNWIMPPDFVEFAGYSSATKSLLNLVCTQAVIGYDICYLGGFNGLAGADSLGITKEFFPTVIGHFPAGASRKSLLHFAQISLRKTFAKYDYGASENFKKYLSFSPPEYDLSKVTMPVELLSGRNDAVSTLDDVKHLMGKLSNVTFREVSNARFNHLDHLWAFDAYEQEYLYILDRLKLYN